MKRNIKKMTVKMQSGIEKVSNFFELILNCFSKSNEKEEDILAKSNLDGSIPIIRNSLFCLSPDSKLRRILADILQKSKIWNYVITISIIFCIVILALDNPFTEDKQYMKIIFLLDAITTSVFILEIAMNSIAYGFLFNGKFSYLRHGYNVIDFSATGISTAYICVNFFIVYDLQDKPDKSLLNVFRFIKLFRIMRVFKIVSMSRKLQAALKAFLKSVSQMLKIILIGSIFILIFAVIGMTYFRGIFRRCDFRKVPDIYMYKINNKWDCLDYGGEWINPYPNFDNISSSFILLFEMMTTENWTYYMYASMDAVGIDLQPIKEYRYPWAFFFIVYMIIAYFLLLNLSIAILSDNFKKEKAMIENSQFKLPLQIEFYNIYKNLFKIEIPRKQQKLDKLTKALLNIIESIYFDVLITVCIIANMILMMMNWPDIDTKTSGLITNMNNIFSWIFVGEAGLKIYVFRREYFQSGWNLLDFIVVCESVTSNIISAFSTDGFSKFFDTSILRTIRVGRILRILKKAESLNRIFNLFLNSIPGVINLTILYILLVFIYSVIGISLFGSLKYQTYINDRWNFQNIANSMFLLVRITSGEKWNEIMHESLKIRKNGFYCKYYDEMTDYEKIHNTMGCGSLVAIPFFCSFVLLSNMMFLEFFSVIIASALNDTYVINLQELRKGQIQKFKNKWAFYDKEVFFNNLVYWIYKSRILPSFLDGYKTPPRRSFNEG